MCPTYSMGNHVEPERYQAGEFNNLSIQYLEIQKAINEASPDVVLDDFFRDLGMIIPDDRSRGHKRDLNLQVFANLIIFLQDRIDFKLSSRGWAYQLEGFGLITKDEFDRAQRMINICRKEGLLPIDFVAEEASRAFDSVTRVQLRSPTEFLKDELNAILELHRYHTPDYWNGEEYYIQVLVEKVDLVTLFKPICEKYKIPIANSKGWSSISQRAELIERFRIHENAGRKPVLLICGDHDPAGLQITDLIAKNLNDLRKGTGWVANNLIVDRFGLNFDFIEENNLTWIDNLITGSGKEADESVPSVADYVDQFGRRKCEANAIVVRPDQARELCEDAILKYLGDEAIKRQRDKRKIIKEKYESILDENGLSDIIREALETFEEDDEE